MSLNYTSLRIKDTDAPDAAARKRWIADGLLRLRSELRDHLGTFADDETHPPDSKDVLRLATWNLREFGKESKYGRRLEDAYYFIAEIASQFDLIALQEVTRDLYSVKRILRLLGGGWKAIATDVSGNSERMVFMFNQNTCRFRDIAGELTLGSGDEIYDPRGVQVTETGGAFELRFPESTNMPLVDPKRRTRAGEEQLKEATRIPLPAGTRLELPQDSELIAPTGTPVFSNSDETQWRLWARKKTSFELPKKWALELPDGARASGLLQFARTPYMVAFQAGWLKVLLCTVHIYYGSDSKDALERRRREIERLTEFLAKRADAESDSEADSFFIALGDFNIKGKDHGTYDALQSNGFEIPDAIESIPLGTNVKRDKYYDQIAVFNRPTVRQQRTARVEVVRAGVFDFFKHVFRRGDDDPGGDDEEHYMPLMNAELERRRDAGRTRAQSWNYKDWRTFQMSDHLPMWVELKIDFANDYLQAIVNPDND